MLRSSAELHLLRGNSSYSPLSPSPHRPHCPQSPHRPSSSGWSRSRATTLLSPSVQHPPRHVHRPTPPLVLHQRGPTLGYLKLFFYNQKEQSSILWLTLYPLLMSCRSWAASNRTMSLLTPILVFFNSRFDSNHPTKNIPDCAPPSSIYFSTNCALYAVLTSGFQLPFTSMHRLSGSA